MTTFVKEVQKLTSEAKAANRNVGGPFDRNSKRTKREGSWKKPAKHDSSLLPGFDKTKLVVELQLGNDRPPI
jgi:hypothetical protein